MRGIRFSFALFFIGFVFVTDALPVFAAGEAVSRRDGFLLIWQSIDRPSAKTSEKPFIDVQPGDLGFTEITYAKARGILDDAERFSPSAPLKPLDALLLIFRTRSVEPVKLGQSRVMSKLPEAKDVSSLAEFYGLDFDPEGTWVSQSDLLALMRGLDSKLDNEIHEVSLYSEKFNGHGTAFGETFDMNALTAAHRTFPYNTLVRVTNVANGQSVVVRINDRGPFVAGRDMDLSLYSFTRIADRSAGKITARFERLGDANLVRRCQDDRYQQRIVRGVVLEPGIPHTFTLGQTLTLYSISPFVIRDVFYPDGTDLGMQKWVVRGSTYEFIPSEEGTYRFLVGSRDGRVREMTMEVVKCN
jgi:hypothetical protein